jgi:hypothetical protein
MRVLNTKIPCEFMPATRDTPSVLSCRQPVISASATLEATLHARPNAKAKDAKMHLLEVNNPVAVQRGVLNAISASNRPDSLDDKTVGLIWSGTHGGDIALKRAGEMLQERFENVSINFYTGGNYPTPPAIVQQAGEECDVIIGATAD